MDLFFLEDELWPSPHQNQIQAVILKQTQTPPAAAN
jgi:hypothetical protein